jgi:hypothetical protein
MQRGTKLVKAPQFIGEVSQKSMKAGVAEDHLHGEPSGRRQVFLDGLESGPVIQSGTRLHHLPRLSFHPTSRSTIQQPLQPAHLLGILVPWRQFNLWAWLLWGMQRGHSGEGFEGQQLLRFPGIRGGKGWVTIMAFVQAVWVQHTKGFLDADGLLHLCGALVRQPKALLGSCLPYACDADSSFAHLLLSKLNLD